MPYRGNNYSFVIDSSFRPFTFQEMLAPYTIYKDASEKAEEAYTELKTKAGDFAYLSQTLPEGSKAREIYEGYANDLNTQAEDFAQHGLSMGNRRALTGLKQRYQGEIGRLSKADEALRKERELRRQMGAKDSSLLYAADNLSIDDFLDNNTPNLYSISGNELYVKGAAAGKAASSRIYSNPDVQKLDDYYNNYFHTVGYSPEKMQEFRDNLAAIPELQRAAMDIAKANNIGELGEGSANYQAALQQIVNGIADGAIYERKDNMQRNLGVMTAAEQAADARAKASDKRAQQSLELTGIENGYVREGNKWVFKPEILKERAEALGVNGFDPNNWEMGPDGKWRKKENPKPDPDVAAAEKQVKKLRNAKTLSEVDKAGYVPIFATVHPSHGSSKGLSLEEATKQEKYDNIEGWRSGPQGMDVPDLYIDWTGAPLVRGSNSGFMPDIFQWKSGTSTSPNNGDFAYGESDLRGRQVKILSDQEYEKLPPAVIKSIKEELYRQGYEDGVEFQVMEVAGKGDKRSYMTMVKKEDQILQGE